MENHPIPQDITGFQFKIIGNMTVKQFVYLAVGGIFAWLFFFIFNLPTLLKWPLSIVSFGAGASLAFIPVDGRPMDVMLGNFFRAIVSPTQFIYKKGGDKISEEPSLQTSNPIPNSAYVQNQPPPQLIALQKPPISPPAIQPQPQPIPDLAPIPQTPVVMQIQPQSISTAQPIPEMPSNSVPTILPISLIEEINEPKEEKINEDEINKGEKAYLQKQIDDLQKQLEESKTKQSIPVPMPAPVIPQPEKTQTQEGLESQLAESTRQREALEKQILQMNANTENAATQAHTPTVAKPLSPTQRVRSVPPGMEKSVGIPGIPEAPNLVTGIIKDPRGNPLPNILIEIKDQDSNPVRAFKTNGLGRFASATSLSNGKYLITFEDSAEKNKFDAVQIELVGTPVMPLEILSVDPREELRRELFN